MATSSISGLVERSRHRRRSSTSSCSSRPIPQSRLKTQQTTEKSVLTALRALNTDASLLASKAETLAKAGHLADREGTVTGSRRHGVSVDRSAHRRSERFSVTVDQLGHRAPARLRQLRGH